MEFNKSDINEIVDLLTASYLDETNDDVIEGPQGYTIRYQARNDDSPKDKGTAFTRQEDSSGITTTDDVDLVETVTRRFNFRTAGKLNEGENHEVVDRLIDRDWKEQWHTPW